LDVPPCSLLEGYESFTGFRPLSHERNCRRRLVTQKQSVSFSCPDDSRCDVRPTLIISENWRLVQC